MEKKRLKIMETCIRDGQQSLIATRMPFEDMEPALALMDKVGYEGQAQETPRSNA